MKITIDEDGVALSDVKAREMVAAKIRALEDIHTSQSLVIDLARAFLLRIPVANRPDVQWEIYGKKAVMDKDLRSFDLTQDARMGIWDDALQTLCGWDAK